MKQIYEVCNRAWELGLRVSEITLTQGHYIDLLAELGGPIDQDMAMVNTPWGTVKIVKEGGDYERP